MQKQTNHSQLPWLTLAQLIAVAALLVSQTAFAQVSGTSSTTAYVELSVNVAKAYHDAGNGYIVAQDFGTTPDSTLAPKISVVRIFENGRELGPAHSIHRDIRNLGLGRFSHWGNATGATSVLYFSASDNSNPSTNGRKYTYRIYSQPVPTGTSSYLEAPINIAKAYRESGHSYIVSQDFGTSADSVQMPTISKLRVFENGRELGPAHSMHKDIRAVGLGRFSHWSGSTGKIGVLYLSASDNSNPTTNGRKYTYRIYSQASGGTSTSNTSTSGSSPTTPTPPPSPPPSTPTTTPPPSPTTSGPTFYVSPNGSDSNSGSQSAPWRTIQAAARRMVAGETAILTDGTYEEGQIAFSNSGTPDKPITLRAQNKWGAILSSVSGSEPAISTAKSYITIENLRISVSPKNVRSSTYTSKNAAIRGWNTLDPSPSNPSSGAEGLVVRGVLVDYSADRDTGIKTNQDFSLIENNVVYNEIEVFNAKDVIIRNNTVYSGSPFGTHILGKGGARNMQIYNNTVHMTTSGGVGIILGGSSGLQWVYDSSTGTEAYNAVAYNNIVINESGDPYNAAFQMRGASNSLFANNVAIKAGVSLYLGGATGVAPQPSNLNPQFVNNIFLGDGTQAATNGRNGWAGYSTGTLTVDHNNFSGFPSGVPAQTNAIVGAPNFVNPLSDWHLQPGSAALGSGVETSFIGFTGQKIDMSKNKDGGIRAVPWNLGAY